MDALKTLFGVGDDLNALQMSARGVTIFLVALLMLRVAGRRSFGQKNPFDACVTVLLGAVLSRAVVGASPFLTTVAAAGSIVLMHRFVGWLSVRSDWFDRLAGGEPRVLLENGKEQKDEMRKAQISDRDLAEAIRKKLGSDDRTLVAKAMLERDGEVSVEKVAG